MEQARINIIEPNGVRRSVPLSPRGIIIGRDPESDIVIGYERASRHHTQIAFDGQTYYVIDLESTNGTYLGRDRLEPNVPTEWLPGVPVRIGDIYFQLEQPDFLEQQREEMGAMETVAGYVPPGDQASGSNKLLYIVAGFGLLCGCAGLGAVAFMLLSSPS